MKHLSRLVAVAAILFFASSSQAQDTGQKIRISQGRTVLGTYGVTGAATTAESPASVSINDATGITFESLDAIPNTVGNRLCSGVTDGNCGWYKAFWIFGDGNYKNFPNNVLALDAPSRTIPNYRYGAAGTYNPVVYLTEKYHNTRPPEEARATINVGGSAPSGTYTEITQRLPIASTSDRKLDIDFNHTPRVDYPMNFVLSYRKLESATNVLFYYNSLISNNYSSYTPTDLFTFKQNEATSYQGSGYAPQVESALGVGRIGSASATNSGGGSILDALNSKFKSRLIYNVSDFKQPFPEAMTEFRVFPVMQTLPLASMPTNLLTESPTTRFPAFAAILVGTDSVSQNDPSYGRLIKTALSLFGNITSLKLSPNSQLYVRGIEVLNLKMETSHDPNSLIVTKVEPINANRFKVTFKLTICNKGIGTESSPQLFFNDLTGGKFSAKPQLGPVPDATVTWSGGSAGNAWAALLDGFDIPGVPEDHDPSCRELSFSIETDAVGLARLYQEDPRALEVCVEFSLGQGECSKNEPLTTEGYPGSNPVPIPKTDCGGLLLFLLIAVLAAILLWYLIRGRNS